MNNLNHPELLALLEQRNRVPDNYVTQNFPYDKKDEIIAWLKTHEHIHLANLLKDVEPHVVSMYIYGYRCGLEYEQKIIDLLLGDR